MNKRDDNWKPKKGEANWMPTHSIRMEPKLWKKLKVAGEQTGVGRPRLIRIIITEYLKEHGLGNLQGPQRGEGYVPIHDLRDSEIE